MSLFRTIWRTTVIFLLYRCTFQVPASPSGPRMGIICQGSVTVEPGPLFRMGSNLTVYCTTTKPHCGQSLSVELNGQDQTALEILNCSTVRLRLTNLRTPNSILVCRLRQTDGRIQTVCGLDLHTGYPPDEPSGIACQASRDSEEITCSWSRGRETHLVTTYYVSVRSVNRAQVFHREIQGTGVFSIPRLELDENEQYQLSIRAHNHLGTSLSQPFNFSVNDVVIPDTPQIMKLEFWSGSRAAVLHWNCSEYPKPLRPHVRLRTGNGSWVELHLDPSRGLVKVEGLKPMTQYEFQIRVCFSIERPTSAQRSTPALRNSSTQRPLCSRWSPSASKTSPGIAPTRELDVWRVFGIPGVDGVQDVTVLWKPLSPGDYSGHVLRYDLVYLHEGQRQEEITYPAGVTQCSVQVSPGVQELFVRAVTSYGTSPPATIQLKHTGVSGPVLRSLSPANVEGGDAVALSWSWDGSSGAETEVLLGFLVEWKSGHQELGWQRVARKRNTTLITGLTPGVRYNVSLYADTTWGVSNPSSGLVYSREDKPVSVPKVSVLAHETSRVLIQWEELPVDQQRGFLTHYNIYLKRLDSDTDQNQRVGLVAGMSLVATIIMVIMANLMCWSCVRKRIKQTCLSLGPVWLSENLPKPGNSNAISLLKHEEPVVPALSWLFTVSDPPLSPIEEIPPGEREELYPIIHIVRLQGGARAGGGEGTGERTAAPLENIGYKPQITITAPRDKTEKEEYRGHIPSCESTDRCPEESGGLLGGWLCDITVDFSGISPALDLSSMGRNTSPSPPKITSLFSGDTWLDEKGLEVGLGSLDSAQGQKVALEDPVGCLAKTLTTGYFPQAADLNTTTYNH
ncbi:interleukin-23 receptor isoform X2 [Salvelinus sp. IW2-2015]|uniref:interleukin-23 receptor isoform X2 n=1 Tax=Salvelinus sp. IW2-2015 TaxID=2691554 RepID=UPI000CDF9693|nr:interleukin-12 receptor subunit beta-2 isoform X2 [Salvelinus alpinus]